MTHVSTVFIGAEGFVSEEGAISTGAAADGKGEAVGCVDCNGFAELGEAGRVGPGTGGWLLLLLVLDWVFRW